MGKKCIPGVFCIENMTLFVLMFILLLVVYIYYVQFIKFSSPQKTETKIVVVNPQQSYPTINLGMATSRTNPMTDFFSPPLKVDADMYLPPDSGDIRGIPVNVKTRGGNPNYQQVGILTRLNGGSQEMILPLMGRRVMSGRDKWQYYTMSNTGNLNTKLPVSVNGRSCTGEYGCDSIMNGDTIYVEGYNDTFKATIYENNLFNYIPF
jgi:hypothetical protein